MISPLSQDLWSPHLKTSPYDRVATWSHVTNKKRYISIFTKPLTATLDKVEVYSKRPPSIESFDALITWSSYHVTNEKRYISTSARPWLPNLTELLVLMPVYYPSSHITYWWRGHIRSHDKWKMWWIHSYVTCHYQTWHKGGLWKELRDKWTSLYLYITIYNK